METNHLIRDVLCGNRDPLPLTKILDEVCALEGIEVDLPQVNHTFFHAKRSSALPPPCGEIITDRAGLIVSPHSGRELPVELPDWRKWHLIACPESGRLFSLPSGLPVPDGIVNGDRPGFVWSPYMDLSAEPMPIPSHELTDGVEAIELRCMFTGEPFKLWKDQICQSIDEPVLPHAVIVSALRHQIRSPHSPNSGVMELTDEFWKPGVRLRCHVTGEFFQLPDNLPSFKATKIAISYRRDDAKPVVSRLYEDVLAPEFGEDNVFFDLDSIPPGEEFRQRILSSFRQSAVILVFIGQRWRGENRAAAGGSRLDDEHDPVRMEVVEALKLPCTVIPVLIDRAPMPQVEHMPGEMASLCTRNAFELDSGRGFKRDATNLMQHIKKVMAEFFAAS